MPAPTIRDERRRTTVVNGGEKSGDVGRNGGDRALRNFVCAIRVQPRAQRRLDVAPPLGEPLIARTLGEGRRENTSGDADRSLRDAQLLAQSRLDAEQTLGGCRRRDRVDGDRLVARSEPERATNALLESRRVPRQIEMHDHRRFLKIESLAQQVGGDQEVDALRRRSDASDRP